MSNPEWFTAHLNSARNTFSHEFALSVFDITSTSSPSSIVTSQRMRLSRRYFTHFGENLSSGQSANV